MSTPNTPVLSNPRRVSTNNIVVNISISPLEKPLLNRLTIPTIPHIFKTFILERSSYVRIGGRWAAPGDVVDVGIERTLRFSSIIEIQQHNTRLSPFSCSI